MITNSSLAGTAKAPYLLTAGAVDATGGGRWLRGQACVGEVEGDGAVLEEEAGDADVAIALHILEGGMGVAQTEKLFEMAHMSAEVNELKTGVTLHLTLHNLAVRAGVHDIYLYHRIRIRILEPVSQGYLPSVGLGIGRVVLPSIGDLAAVKLAGLAQSDVVVG